jgi:hypothetical protein
MEKGQRLIGSKSWQGPQPVFRKLWWQGQPLAAGNPDR